jgi:glycosyltransferase involved in cell wall biosynthesis
VTSLHVVLPNDIDDVSAPSGGNRYDREICNALVTLGWSVCEHAARGAWPEPDAAELAALGDTLAGLPPGAAVLVDGLVASAAAEVVTAHAERLRLVVLVHMPFGDTDAAARPAEQRALRAAAGVIATSDWTKRRLAVLYGLSTDRLHVATPGVDEAPLATGSGAGGGSLLCVAVVGRHKGHDVLVDALAKVADLPWSCVCAGSLDRDPGFVRQLAARIRALGLEDRLRLAGPLGGGELAAAYAAADLLVHPSRGETYGMVAVEALARGIPVLATTAKGLPDAVGSAPGGEVPGLLVPPGDPAALAKALRRWLSDGQLRKRLRTAALGRRDTLTGWPVAAHRISETLHAITRNAP